MLRNASTALTVTVRQGAMLSMLAKLEAKLLSVLEQLSTGLVPAQAVHLTLQPPKLNEGSAGGSKGLGHQTAILLLQSHPADSALYSPNMQLGNQLPDLAVGDAAEQPLEKLSQLAYVQRTNGSAMQHWMVDSSSSLATLVSPSTLVQGGVAEWLHECHREYGALK
ncbi:MAG: hypothetical protein FRX49_05499 [Trebouxia sp. A1-2]|nr:MAG: hypothetical protein FRX49_05499 [Trebouxia sp. A1-2]